MEKQEFISYAKEGKILAHKCTNCKDLHLATVYFCKKCGKRGFEDVVLDGHGIIETYTIMTVPPAGFEKYSPYAWAVMNIDNSDLRISGFIPNIAKSDDLPIGTKAKVLGFDNRGIVLKIL
tara:strand:- start:393 stop:755 length:363 start_codon:yes stop_codon:yes gene_type:complete